MGLVQGPRSQSPRVSLSPQFWLTMSYLSQMTEEQTLVMYSGHPLGLFPSSPGAPRLVITNGMVGPRAAGRARCPHTRRAIVPKGTVPPPALSPALLCRSFPTTPPGWSTRSSLPWGLPCKYWFGLCSAFARLHYEATRQQYLQLCKALTVEALQHGFAFMCFLLVFIDMPTVFI